MLRLEPAGPASYVAALAFDPTGNTLFAGGWDKVVRAWQRDNATGRFEFDDNISFRVPVGPGNAGSINALAVSPNGRWIAVAGRGLATGEAGFRSRGRAVEWSIVNDAVLGDIGVVHVFDRLEGRIIKLRGHLGVVLSLAFVEDPADEPLLVSMGWEKNAGVARLWQIEEDGRQVAVQAVSTSQPIRPSCTARRVGPLPQQVLAAIAWGDGTLRVWNVAENKMQQTAAPARNNNTVAQLPGGNRLLTGARGFLTTWALGATGRVARQQVRQLRARCYVRDLAILARADGTPLAAVIVLNRAAARYELWLVDPLAARGSGVQREVELWPENLFLPALATSRDGTQIAVGGSGNQRIHIHQVSRLLAGDSAPQVVEGAAAEFRSAAFASDGNSLGLALRRSTAAADELDSVAQADFVFDIMARQVVDSASSGAQWRIARAAASTRDPEPILNQLRTARHTITATATAVRGDLHLLAVGTFIGGNSLLWWYDLQSGEKIRECNAHTLPIRSLSFAADGELLVSCGDDHQLCVWDVSDIEQTLKLGAVPFVIEDQENAVRVKFGGTAGFEPGDQLTGIVEQDRFQPLFKMEEFQRAIWSVPPGRRLRIRRERGGRVTDIDVTITKLVDVANPLFSFFLTRQSGNQGELVNWQWIAWSPLGPYDSSTPAVEKFLGWHFNTGDLRAPTAFSRAQHYRDDFRQEGLLASLVQQKRPPPKQEEPPAARPVMHLMVPGISPSAVLESSEVMVREPPQRAKLHVLSFRNELIDRVEWSLGGTRRGLCAPTSDGAWAADLAGFPWGREDHRLQMTLTTNETSPQQFQQDLLITVVPPAPRIEFANLPPIAQQQQVVLPIQIVPAEGESVSYHIVHRSGSDRQVLGENTVNQPTALDTEVRLELGNNSIEVEAVNDAARPLYRSQETARRTINISRQGIVIVDPEIRFVGGESPAVLLRADQPTLVKTERIELFSHVRGSVPVTFGELHVRDREDRELARHELVVAPAGEDGTQTLATAEPLVLPPGTEMLRIVTGSAGLRESLQRPVRLLPPLPAVVIDSPLDGESVFEPTVAIAAHLESYRPAADIKLSLLVNGEPQELGGLENALGKLAASPVLRLGENAIEIRVTRDDETASDRIHVVYRSPPRLSELTADTVDDKPLVRLLARVTSPTELQAYEVNGTPVDARAVRAATESWEWTVEIANVPLQRGDNSLDLRVRNPDGWSQPASTQIHFAPQPPPPPLARIVSPEGDQAVNAAEVAIEFDVSSKSPLRAVRLLRDWKIVFRAEAEQLRGQDASGRYFLHESVPIQVDPGSNRFRLVAINEGGESTDEIQLTAPRLPVRIEIDSISVSESPDDDALIPVAAVGNRLSFERPAPRGEMWLQGRVVWFQSDARLDDPRQSLRVWVNGFQQIPAKLEAPGPQTMSRRFRIQLVMNQAEGNLVELSLPGLNRSDDSQVSFRIDCQQPESDRALHLLVVGVGVPRDDRTVLVDRALGSLQASRIAGNRSYFTSPAFAYGKVWGPLVGENIKRGQVQTLLMDIQDEISARAISNNVVLIYYQGGEVVNEANRFFLTTTKPQEQDWQDLAKLQREAISSEWLQWFVRNTHGAHLLLLDVAREPSAIGEQATLPPESRAAMLRFAWMKTQEAPRDELLISRFDGAMAPSGGSQQAVMLMDVAQRLADHFEPRENRFVSKGFPDSLIYEAFVPSSLAGLILRGTTGADLR